MKCNYFGDITDCVQKDCQNCGILIEYQAKQNREYARCLNCGKEAKVHVDGLCDDCHNARNSIGKKFDKDKSRWDLLPLTLIKETVDVLTFGAQKYGPNNWRNVEDGLDRYYAALMRHIVAYRNGEIHDPESGLSHLSHAMCNLIFMHELQEHSEDK